MVTIKQFEDKDLKLTKELVKSAFYREVKDNEFNEWNFIQNVIDDESFVDELCLLAKIEDEQVGYILLTKANIGKDLGLVLGPLAVKPKYQKTGIGKKLVKYAIDKAEKSGYNWIALTGGDYYYQFGFKDAATYNVIINEGHQENKYLKIILLNNYKRVNEGCIKFAESFYDDNGELL